MQQHFDTNQKHGHEIIWQDWKMRVKNELFRKACHQLLGEKAVDEDSGDTYTFNNIQAAIPRTREDREIKEALVAECKAIDVLNCWMLSEASEMEEPIVD